MNSNLTNQQSKLMLLEKLVHSLEVKQDGVASLLSGVCYDDPYQQGYFDALEYVIERLTKEYNLIKETDEHDRTT